MYSQIFNILWIVFILVLIIFRIFNPRRSMIQTLLRKLRRPWLLKLLEQKEYDKIAKHYMRKAKRTRRGCLRENSLGIAKLYKHQTQEAIEHFITASKSAVGKESVNTINNNLAMAFLQQGAYYKAISILDEQRENGYVFIAPYTLSLLIKGETDEANTFYQYAIKKPDPEDKALQKLLNVNPKQPETLTPVKNLVKEKELWLYQPVVKYLIQQWENEIFFLKPERYELLVNEGRILLAKIDSNPELFTNSTIRYIRSIVSLLVARVSNYQECASLFGLISNLDSFCLEQSLPGDLGKDCANFFDRVYYAYYKIRSADFYDQKIEDKLIQDQCPEDAKPIVPKAYSAQIYFSRSYKIGVRVHRNMDPNELPIAYVDIISEAEALTIKGILDPILEVIPLMESDTQKVLHSLVNQVITDRHSVSSDHLIDILTMVPKNNHTSFQQLRDLIEA